MADTLRLEIVTPQAVVYSEDVHMVTLPAVEGQMGVYPNHVHVITPIEPGEIIVTTAGAEQILTVGEGIAEITADRVSIATDMALPADQLEEAKIDRSFAQLQVRKRRRM
jgi:F-type H+-transporting ATPase subunit epsilon